MFWYNDHPVFMGYVFKKQRDKNHHIKVTAYDQLRYLKNKFTYVFQNKTASDIVKTICSDFNLNIGEIETTNYNIQSIVFDNKTLFDIILEALSETVSNTGNLYTLYDNFGKITLKNISNMKTNFLIDSDTLENFDYESSIDNETYNQILLYYVDPDTNKRVPFIAKDTGNINQWGLLQYFEEVNNLSIGQNKADTLLKLYNKKTRSLKLKNVFGDPKIRAGCFVVVSLNLGDIIQNNYMLVDEVTHNFKKDQYLMDITVSGNWGE